MTLVKAKSRTSPSRRKLAGQHHRQNQKYLKAYWPYLPIFIVLGGSLLASQLLPSSLNGNLNPSYSARIDSYTGGPNALILDILYFVLACLLVWYVLRHFKRIKGIALEGEHYLARHYVLDVFVGLLIGCLFILAR